jgi:hypothetical protein
VRRYTRANRLSYLWTLTYRQAADDRAQVVADLRRFFKRCREKRWGPMVAVVERGTEGTKRLHVHWAVSRFIDRHDVQWYWHHGNVDVGDRGQLAGRQQSRELAAYLAKYVTKDLVDDAYDGQGERVAGTNRYHVAQGYTPAPWRREFYSDGEAVAWAEQVYGVADVEIAFGTKPEDNIWGVWRSYPDGCLWSGPAPNAA